MSRDSPYETHDEALREERSEFYKMEREGADAATLLEKLRRLFVLSEGCAAAARMNSRRWKRAAKERRRRCLAIGLELEENARMQNMLINRAREHDRIVAALTKARGGA